MTASAGTLVAGRYRLERPIGQGGNGIVYAAKDERTGDDVAVKVLKAELLGERTSVERLRREARIASQLSHPNVVKVHELVVEPTLAALVMELLVGQSLAVRIQQVGTIAAEVVATIGAQIARALAAGHAAGVIHRDVKPDNVFLAVDASGRERAKLLDFGIVKASETRDERLTATNTVLGTWQYMPPEQAHGRPLDGRADVYALGATLFYALTRKRLYQASGMEASMFALTEVPAPPLASVRPDVDPELAAIVDRAVAKPLAARWPDATAFAEALEAWLGAEPPTRAVPTEASVDTVTRTGVNRPETTLESPRPLGSRPPPAAAPVVVVPGRASSPDALAGQVTLHSPGAPLAATSGPRPSPRIGDTRIAGSPPIETAAIESPVSSDAVTKVMSHPSVRPVAAPPKGISRRARFVVWLVVASALYVLGYVGGRLFLFR